MNIPDKSHPKWKGLVTGSEKYELQGLSTRILLGRLVLKYELDNNSLEKLIDELRDYFIKNAQTAQADLKKIFG